MLRLGAAQGRKLLLLSNSKQMVSRRAAPWHAVSPLVAATPEFLFRDSLLYFMGIAEQAEPRASEEFPGKYPPAHPSRSGTSLPGGDDRHGTLSSPFEVLRHHGPNRQIFVTIQTGSPVLNIYSDCLRFVALGVPRCGAAAFDKLMRTGISRPER